MKTISRLPAGAALIAVALLAFAEPTFAIAGGGDLDYGLGILGVIIVIILAPFLLVWAVYVAIRFSLRRFQAERGLRRSEQTDSTWNADALKRDVEKMFFKVQEAWMERNQTLAKDCMSAALFAKHKSETDRMKKDKEKNIMKNITVDHVTILGLADYRDNAKDSVKVYIEGTMVDYTIDETTKAVIRGNIQKAGEFYQLWTLIRENGAWVVDRIQSQLDKIGAVKQTEVFIEK